jgi:hypothetical protein
MRRELPVNAAGLRRDGYLSRGCSLILLALFQVLEYPPDDAGLGNERDDSKLAPAARTNQRVHFVDSSNELGPSASQSRPLCWSEDGLWLWSIWS